MNEVLRQILGLPVPASSVAHAIDALHSVVFITTLLGASIVGLVALSFAVRFRRRADDPPTPRITASMPLEWCGIAFLVVLFVGFWYVGYRQFLQLQTVPPGAIPITVSAKQWMWSFSYQGGQRSLSMLVVPTGTPVQLQMVSRDVIHGFFVPAFRIKHDVVPGVVSSVWFQVDQTGTFPIFCTQYCGTSHSSMRGEVVALPPAEYAAWLQGSAAPTRQAREDEAVERRSDSGVPGLATRGDFIRDADPVELGRQAAARHGCLSCHTEDGQRHIGPTFRGLYASLVPLTDGRTVRADGAYLTRSMMDPLADVVAGYQPVMPSYQGMLDPDAAATILEFIRSLSGPAASAAPRNPPLPAEPLPAAPGSAAPGSAAPSSGAPARVGLP